MQLLWLENLPTATAVKRMMDTMIGLFCASFGEVPRRIVLDIDDTEDRVYGGQQLALFQPGCERRAESRRGMEDSGEAAGLLGLAQLPSHALDRGQQRLAVEHFIFRGADQTA